MTQEQKALEQIKALNAVFFYLKTPLFSSSRKYKLDIWNKIRKESPLGDISHKIIYDPNFEVFELSK